MRSATLAVAGLIIGSECSSNALTNPRMDTAVASPSEAGADAMMPEEGADAADRVDAVRWTQPVSPDASAARCAATNIVVSKNASVICAIRCVSGDSNGDVSVAIDQVEPATVDGGSPQFTARVTQSIPQGCDETFLGVVASSSGNFLNFNGANSQYRFHVLTNGAAGSGMNNVEVYTDPSTEMGGPVYVPGSGSGSLVCSIYPF